MDCVIGDKINGGFIKSTKSKIFIEDKPYILNCSYYYYESSNYIRLDNTHISCEKITKNNETKYLYVIVKKTYESI